jgi:hypothetical protein
VIVDVQGRPLNGVQVFADHTLYYNTNARGVSDSTGRYRIDVSQPTGSWHALAQLRRNYHGQTYTFALDPNDDTPFAGSAGAVRNFIWRLSGSKPDGEGVYGGLVTVYADYANFTLVMRDVELTLVPDGALVDGSTGAPITRRLLHTADGDAMVDVPVGRYTITARYVPVGGTPRTLMVRLRDQGDYQASLVTDFVQQLSWQSIVLQVDDIK